MPHEHSWGTRSCYHSGMAVLSGYADVKPLTDRLLTDLRAALGERLVAMALYGSVARQAARPTSDIDLFIVHRGDRHAALCSFVEVEIGLRDDPLTSTLRARGVPSKPMPVFRSESSLADTPWLLLDIAHHGIMLFDPRGVLGRKLAYVRKRLAELGSRRIEIADGSWYWDLKPDLRPGETVTL